MKKCLAFDGLNASVPARLSARMPGHPSTRLAGCRGAPVRVRVEIDRKSHANAADETHFLPLVSASALALPGQLLARGQALGHVGLRRHRREDFRGLWGELEGGEEPGSDGQRQRHAQSHRAALHWPRTLVLLSLVRLALCERLC